MTKIPTTLTQEQQEFLIQQYAEGRAPKEARARFFDAFSVRIQPSQAAYYNPRTNSDLSQNLRDLYTTLRARFTTDLAAQPAAHLPVVMERIWEMAEKEREAGNHTSAAELYLQAFRLMKEEGGAVPLPTPGVQVNQQFNFGGGAGAALPAGVNDISQLTGRQQLAALFGVSEDVLPPVKGETPRGALVESHAQRAPQSTEAPEGEAGAS